MTRSAAVLRRHRCPAVVWIHGFSGSFACAMPLQAGLLHRGGRTITHDRTQRPGGNRAAPGSALLLETDARIKLPLQGFRGEPNRPSDCPLHLKCSVPLRSESPEEYCSDLSQQLYTFSLHHRLRFLNRFSRDFVLLKPVFCVPSPGKSLTMV